MTTSTLTLTEFLLARIADDEAVAERAERLSIPTATYSALYNGVGHHPVIEAPRLLAECEAKRRIVEPLTMPPVAIGGGPAWTPETAAADRERRATLEEAARILAAVYADHPDYRGEWRP